MMNFLASDPQLQALLPYLTSLGLGLLMGFERERSPNASAGLRTFALTAMLGCLLGELSVITQMNFILVAGVLAVVITVVGGEFMHPSTEAGITTPIALVLCFGLGVLVWFDRSQLAIMLAVISSVLLYFKPELKSLSARFNRQDLLAILQFAVLSFVILPILPDRSFGPYGVLNPRRVWWVVVFVSGLNLAAYIVLKLVVARAGAALIGVLGGLVSSTATTMMFSRKARLLPSLAPVAALIILLAITMVPLRLFTLVAVLAADLLPKMAVLLLPSLLLGGLALIWQWRREVAQSDLPPLELPNPASLRVALGFAALYCVVLLFASALTEWAGSGGSFLASMAAGLANMDAITISNLRLFTLGRLPAEQVTISIGLALLSNTLVKIALLAGLGGRVVIWHCFLPLLATVSGLLLGLLLLFLI